jgi:hypothetical protein
MARSFIDPSVVAMAAQPAAPPWDWNPGATFVTAFNDAQRNKREQEKMALEMELAEILLPYKKETAALQLEKLKQDVELSTLLTAQKRKAQSTAHPSIMDAVRNPSRPPRSYNSLVRIGRDGSITPSMIEQSEPDLPAITTEDTLEEF